MVKTYKKEFKDIWLKASVLGSLWGSFEIIIGSFFHNIRFPMAGTILAVIGISLIAAFGQSWKDRGLFWRAGLISAVMKSVSPSAILLGPMTGILLEALLFELSVFLFGRNVIGYIIGGMLALYSVVIHKITSLIVIYGFDLIRITENFYAFIIKQLSIENLSFLHAFLLISSIYLLLGLFASIFGILIGKAAISRKEMEFTAESINIKQSKEVVRIDDNVSSIALLIFNFLFIIIVLALTNLASLELAAVLTFVYVIFAVWKYKRPLRFFKRPWFWIQISLFIFVSALFYNGFSNTKLFTYDGLIAGFKMGVRAILIVVGFSAVSSELRNPFIRIFLYRKGFWQFYTALGLAFSVLPFLIKKSAKAKKILRNPFNFLLSSIYDAENILNEFKKRKVDNEVIIITGPKHYGKTTFANSMIEYLKEKSKHVKGFTAPGKFNNGIRSEFNIQNVETGEQIPLCNIIGNDLQKKIGRFYFNEAGLIFGKDILKEENLLNAEYVIIDEIGPFELKGRGWTESIEKLLINSDIKMLWVVRKNLLYDILRRFGITKAYIIDIEKNSPKDAVDELISII